MIVGTTLAISIALSGVSLADRHTSNTTKKTASFDISKPITPEMSLGRFSSTRTHFDKIGSLSQQQSPTSINYLQPQQPRVIEAASISPVSRAIATQLVSILVVEPVEAGYDHPAEDVIKKLNATSPLDLEIALDHLISGDGTSHAIKFDLLIMIGRTSPISDEWRAGIISKALASENIDIRDAALQAAEQLMDSSLIPILTAHEEPINWLNRYQKTVISSLHTRNDHA